MAIWFAAPGTVAILTALALGKPQRKIRKLVYTSRRPVRPAASGWAVSVMATCV